ncbi:glycosyltransferase family 2 protein [Luteitalea sp.]
MSAPLSLSVVIPSRDTRALTLRCLAALAASTMPADEVIVVDDGSTDGTAEAIAVEHPSVRVLRLPKPVGFTLAINTGWQEARAEIVLLLNSDTEVEVDALMCLRDAFRADSRLGIAGAALRHPDGRPQWSAGARPTLFWLCVAASGVATYLGTFASWRGRRPESQRVGDTDWVPATAMAVRREVRGTLGTFDTRYQLYAQDLAYCLEAGARGWRVQQLAHVRVRHIGGATVAAQAAGAGGVDPVAYARDLDRWVRVAHAAPRAARLRAALWWGFALRVIGRTLTRPWQAAATRPAYDAATDRYRRARRAMADR